MEKHTVTLTEKAHSLIEEQRQDGQSVSDFIVEQLAKNDDFIHGNGIDKESLTSREQEALALIKEHIRTTKEQDVMGHLETFHPQLRTQELQQTLIQTWSMYDLEYTFTIKNLEVTGDTAEVLLLQTTEKLSGPEFQDSTVVQLFHLVETDEKWLISDSNLVKHESK